MIDLFKSVLAQVKEKGRSAAFEMVTEMFENLKKHFNHEVKVNITVFGNTKFAEQAERIEWSLVQKEDGNFTISADYSALDDWAQDYFVEVAYPNAALAVGI